MSVPLTNESPITTALSDLAQAWCHIPDCYAALHNKAPGPKGIYYTCFGGKWPLGFVNSLSTPSRSGHQSSFCQYRRCDHLTIIPIYDALSLQMILKLSSCSSSSLTWSIRNCSWTMLPVDVILTKTGRLHGCPHPAGTTYQCSNCHLYCTKRKEQLCKKDLALPCHLLLLSFMCQSQHLLAPQQSPCTATHGCSQQAIPLLLYTRSNNSTRPMAVFF